MNLYVRTMLIIAAIVIRDPVYTFLKRLDKWLGKVLVEALNIPEVGYDC